MNQGRRLFVERAILICVLVFAYFVPHDAQAHAALVKSDPGKRATLAISPAKIRLWFNEKLEPAYSTVKLLDSSHSVLATDAAVVDGENPKQISLAIPALKPGSYRVKYRVLSLDGHVVESSFSFTIRPAQ
jgi:copper resistance protein C